MKGSRTLFIGIILGALVVGTLGFLYIPLLRNDISFLLGFIACLTLIALALILVSAWKRHAVPNRLLVNPQVGQPTGISSANNWILISVLVALGGLVSGALIIRQNVFIKDQTQLQSKHIAQQSALIESVRKSSLVYLMSNLLDKVDQELKDDPKGNLSDETIGRIAALSYAFKPYVEVVGDSLSERKLSPERGQLLLALSQMHLDSGTMKKIIFHTTFSGADLRGADLRGADLRGVDLERADLQDADLKRANLQGANLSATNMWGAILSDANLEEVNLTRTDLRWADLNRAVLRNADLSGANLSSAELRNADFREAILKWADASGAFFNETDLTGASLYSTVFSKTNFSKANLGMTDLRLSNLRGANLREANLSDTQLQKATVTENNWLAKLTDWQVTGAKEIQGNYKVVNNGQNTYRLFVIDH